MVWTAPSYSVWPWLEKTRTTEGGGIITVITTIGLDLAKNIFQVHGVDNQGRTTLQKRLSRGKVAAFFANLPPCMIGMEACGGSHYWSRKISEYGHVVRQMPHQYAKPYVKTNKNDANVAEAIYEAASRPNMRFVQTKSLEQQGILAIHRIRERLVNNRTGLANQTRGFLMELGVVFPQGIRHIRKELPRVYEDHG